MADFLQEEFATQAVYCGLSLTDYWVSTIAEVLIYVKAHDKAHRDKLRYIYNLAQLSGMAAAIYTTGSKQKFPEFEALFPEEKKNNIEDWHIAKDRMMKIARLHNKEAIK